VLGIGPRRTSTGEQIWQVALPATGKATRWPMRPKGRQIVVINAGGHDFMETTVGDYFIAYVLPQDSVD
jgi:quinoprotein glucose dehydrogenase